MNTSHGKIETAPLFADDELVALQLRVARRADELATQSARDRAADLERWLQAEREFLGYPPESAAATEHPEAHTLR